MTINVSEQFPALIIVFPLITVIIMVAIGWWWKKPCFYMSFAALSVSFMCSIGLLSRVMKEGTVHYWLGGWEPPWGIEYVVDHLNAYILVIVAFISLIVTVFSKRSIEKEIPDKIPQFYAVYTLLVMGLLGMTVTGDAFNLYVLLEVTSLAGYALIAMGEAGALMASFNYLILGTVGACFYLLGVGYLYIAAGSLNMADLAVILPQLYDSKVVLTAFAFIMVGIAIKTAVFPLHAWLPDSYTHAPSTVSIIAAATMTKVGIYVMIRYLYTVFEPYFSIELLPVHTILGWIAAVAILFGCIVAIMQTDIKRIFSYILVAEVGYIVLGISLSNRNGLTGALLHILNDAFMMACVFAIAGAIMYKVETRNIHDFRNLFKKMPITMGAFVIAGLSIIGIPPTCGFFSKLYLILGALDAQKGVFVAVILASSLLNAVNIARVIEKAFFKPFEPEHAHAHSGREYETVKMDEIPFSMLVPILIMTAGILLLGFYNGDIISNVIQHAIPASFTK
jgi:multicomponent Na+:H+ antiporter subunit D